MLGLDISNVHKRADSNSDHSLFAMCDKSQVFMFHLLLCTVEFKIMHQAVIWLASRTVINMYDMGTAEGAVRECQSVF